MALIKQISFAPGIGDTAPGWLSNLSNLLPVATIKSTLKAIVATTIVHPLARLYLDGPTLLGFWGGASPESICSRLTGVDANFWSLSEDGRVECEDVIRKHFNSWMVLACTVTYFAGTSMIIYITYKRCWRSRSFGSSCDHHHQIVVLPPAYPPSHLSHPSIYIPQARNPHQDTDNDTGAKETIDA